jgi:hypothetical protein
MLTVTTLLDTQFVQFRTIEIDSDWVAFNLIYIIL